MNKKMKLNCGVRLYIDEGGEEEFTLEVNMPARTVVEVLHVYDNSEYASGKAAIIFDGKESCSVCLSLLDEVDES